MVGLVEIIWANTHGAFPLGIVLPGIFLTAAVWEKWRRDGTRGLLSDPVVGCYLACVMVGLAAMFCNPRPASTLDYVAGVASKSSEREVGEWAGVSIPLQAAEQGFPITEYQPVYFVADSLQDAKSRMHEYCKQLPRPFYARYNSATESVWVDRAVRRQMH